MNPTLGLLALAVTFIAAALLPLGGDRTHWVFSTAAVICGVLATLFAFAVIA